jgi:hypothetical protein
VKEEEKGGRMFFWFRMLKKNRCVHRVNVLLRMPLPSVFPTLSFFLNCVPVGTIVKLNQQANIHFSVERWSN